MCTSNTADAAISTITDVYSNCDRNKLEIGFDDNYKPCKLNNSEYYIKVTIHKTDGMLKADIQAFSKDSKDAIYSLHPEHYIG